MWNRNSRVPGSVQPVYGAQHPPLGLSQSTGTSSPAKNQKAKNFDEFQQRTHDAWEFSNDDLTALGLGKVFQDVAESTANSVIENHKKINKTGFSSSPTNAANNGSSRQQSKARQEFDPDVPETYPRPNSRERDKNEREAIKLRKFEEVLSEDPINIEKLRALCWNGIPIKLRPISWRLLTGYLPTSKSRQKETLERKRKEYFLFVDKIFNGTTDFNQDTYRQIKIDIPRTKPLIPLFQKPQIQLMFERILYIWSIRHPASGYVQGINDLVVPFFTVFLSEVNGYKYVDDLDISELKEEHLRSIEADAFWCLTKLLDGIQDNYTFAQPGIQSKVSALKDLMKRIDCGLHEHLEDLEVEYLQFAFRWMNNLLMREIPLQCSIRLWDTYQSEPEGFSNFHLYVCAAFLKYWSRELKEEKDFQGVLLKLQNLPTYHWRDNEINQILAQAYELKCMFADAPSHLQNNSS
ncbi:TBC1 domain family member 22B-like [Symsagittifera roscoffensis]|uniref:TBC1 domain family member 22B-like n=1 Tax=Symsagittifera roscoffensis TaxID=84072 RepID=UPI00307C7312